MYMQTALLQPEARVPQLSAAQWSGLNPENESFRSNTPNACVHLLVTKAFTKALQPELASPEAAVDALAAVRRHSTEPCMSPRHGTAGEAALRTAQGMDSPWQDAAAHEPKRTPGAALVAGVQTPEVPTAMPSSLSRASPRRLAGHLSQVRDRPLSCTEKYCSD